MADVKSPLPVVPEGSDGPVDREYTIDQEWMEHQFRRNPMFTAKAAAWHFVVDESVITDWVKETYGCSFPEAKGHFQAELAAEIVDAQLKLGLKMLDSSMLKWLGIQYANQTVETGPKKPEQKPIVVNYVPKSQRKKVEG